jgi:hypothetical protein
VIAEKTWEEDWNSSMGIASELSASDQSEDEALTAIYDWIIKRVD